MFLNTKKERNISLSSNEIIKLLKENPISFLYKRRDIGYFSDQERQNLMTMVGLEEELKKIFKSYNFISDPVKTIIEIVFHGKIPSHQSQFDKDINILYIKQSSLYNPATKLTLGKLKDRFMEVVSN